MSLPLPNIDEDSVGGSISPRISPKGFVKASFFPLPTVDLLASR
jgi:hypothetical protein